MAYKVTISDGTILEKSVDSVTFKADTPPDNSYCMRTYTINSMNITGRIGAGEKTISLYEWSLLPANNLNCYREIVVEQTHAGQIVRSVKFSKAFVVDYSESYSKGEGFGHFSIFIRQLAEVDIELTNEITPQAIMTEPSNEVEELISPLVQSVGIAAASQIVNKNRPNLTDMIAKKMMMQDNGNVGIFDVPSKADLDAYRARFGVPETNTVAVGKTNVPGLEGQTFSGGSSRVRKEANLPDLDVIAPNRSIKSPSLDVRGIKHAEEGVMYEFEEAATKAGLKPEDINGTLFIHQSNPRGVCTTCLQGVNNPNVPAGIFKQFSEKYPNLTIKATSEGAEGVRASGKQVFTMLNGKFIE